jgi:MoaA/NifB/PqqE/SkfB family radical SAM enzyme
MFDHWQRDISVAGSVLRRQPFSVLIQVTNRCNMRCDFCTFWSSGVRPDKEMTLDDFERLENELAGLGRFMISIEGGEPFVRPDILDIVGVLSRRHVTVLYTNGWYLDPEKARALFANGLSQVGVSIDFPDPARHDAKRGMAGAYQRAWRAVDWLRDAAPRGGRQVQVMTVYMEENRSDLEALLALSAARGVGHAITLLATKGTRRAPGGEWPSGPVSEELLALWKRYPHFRVFRDYLAFMDRFLQARDMPQCRAGVQSFNIDHLGNVAPCIEKIGQPVGNVRREPLRELHARLARAEGVSTCQECWTFCRGTSQLLGQGGSARSWRDLTVRMRASSALSGALLARLP